MVQGSWVGGSVPVSLFPWGRRFHPLCLNSFPFLCSSHLFFLGIGAHRPCSGGIRLYPNKKNIYIPPVDKG